MTVTGASLLRHRRDQRHVYPQDCGYPLIIGTNGTAKNAELNATATIGQDGSSIVMTVTGACELVHSVQYLLTKTKQKHDCGNENEHTSLSAFCK